MATACRELPVPLCMVRPLPFGRHSSGIVEENMDNLSGLAESLVYLLDTFQRIHS